MRGNRRLIALTLLPALALGLWLGLMLVVFRLSLPTDTQAALIFAFWVAGATLGAWLVLRLYDRHVAAVARLATDVQLLAGGGGALLTPSGQGATRALAEAVNRLAQDGIQLQSEMQARIESASRTIAQERDQLGALMAELQQSVIVCNLDGKILLYNDRARDLFQSLSSAPKVSGGAGAIGLGRSVHAVIEPALIAHALETVQHSLNQDTHSTSARFVMTTAAGSLLQITLAPVRGEAGLAGYVLLLDDITEEQAAHSRRDRRLLGLTESSRGALANMQAALDMLDYPDLTEAEREGFQDVVRSEVATMAGRLDALADDTSHDLLTRWPLQDMLGGDLLGAASRRIAANNGPAIVEVEAAPDLWLRVDSFSLIEALAFLAGKLAASGVAEARLRLLEAGNWAHLDLRWREDLANVASWQSDPISLGGASAVTARDIAERHGGELWLEHDRDAQETFFRFLVPIASTKAEQAPAPQRPEFYNFDLFASTDESHALDDRPLDQLTFTVFDCETTGLDPASGDEIIQLGAVRILNGKMIEGEVFDQLVDPRRPIPEVSIPIHGIRPEMVRGQPTIAEVLPAFHGFASDTVLVGHNVAFDMRFLQMKEAQTGLRFEQPVLDTLLLASVAQPHQDSYAMEDIAARLGVRVSARHSALGDALTTSRILLGLIPLLRQQSILTLAEARAAAEKSYYARLKY